MAAMKRLSDFLPLASAWTQRALALGALAAMGVSFAMMEGCASTSSYAREAQGMRRRQTRMEVTGYDSGPRSCNWRRNWYGRPVIASGPNKGKPNAVGITASGTRAHRGTAAADTKYYPFGTILYVQGYGWAKVEDRGGAIKGPARLDLWFSTEAEARKWGRRKNVPVMVYTRD